jgi:hypothetical protein
MEKGLVLLFSVVLFACSKSSPDDLGQFTVDVHILHHAETVSNCSVYLKEYSDDFPGKSISEYHFLSVSDNNGIASFHGILPGNHYLYGLGFDGKDSITGNRAIYIDPHDRDGYAKFLLHVSEKH